MIVISVLRKGAWKRLTISVQREHYMSVLQIFESTTDVVNYHVSELSVSFTLIDMYLPDIQGFKKWIPTPKG